MAHQAGGNLLLFWLVALSFLLRCGAVFGSRNLESAVYHLCEFSLFWLWSYRRSAGWTRKAHCCSVCKFAPDCGGSAVFLVTRAGGWSFGDAQPGLCKGSVPQEDWLRGASRSVPRVTYAARTASWACHRKGLWV